MEPWAAANKWAETLNRSGMKKTKQNKTKLKQVAVMVVYIVAKQGPRRSRSPNTLLLFRPG